MNRNLLILSGLLLLTLAWTVVITHQDKNPSSRVEESIIWKLDENKIQRVLFQAKGIKVEMRKEAEKGQDGPYYWVSSETEKRVPPISKVSKGKKDKKEKMPAPPKPEFKLETEYFKGSRTVSGILSGLAELKVTRTLGKLSDVDIKELGLEKSNQSIDIFIEGEEKPLRIKFGDFNFPKTLIYGHFSGDESVHLFKKSYINPYRQAKRLMMDRDLFPFGFKEVEKIILLKTDGPLEIFRLKDNEKGQQQWGLNPQAEESNPDLDDFIRALSSLKINRYIQPEEKIEAGEQSLEIRIQQKGSKDQPAWLKLFSVNNPEVVADSSHTRKKVILGAPRVKKLFELMGKLKKGA